MGWGLAEEQATADRLDYLRFFRTRVRREDHHVVGTNIKTRMGPIKIQIAAATSSKIAHFGGRK